MFSVEYWHYFDNVIVDALDADDIRLPIEDYVYSLQNRVQLLLYLRKIGAENILSSYLNDVAFVATIIGSTQPPRASMRSSSPS